MAIHLSASIFGNPSLESYRLLFVVFLAAFATAQQPASPPRILTYRPVDSTRGTSNGRFLIPSQVRTDLMFFGFNLTNDTVIKFSENPTSCSASGEVDLTGGGNILITNASSDDETKTATLEVVISVSSTKIYYFCAFSSIDGLGYHQGSEPWLAMVVQPSLLPLWLEIVFILVLMVLSGLFSGLNLGLMSLDPTTLKIIVESGSKSQRKYARLIYRVRRHGNYLLCTLLLGNVLVNSTLTILLDEVLPSGIYAVVASTLTIVIFGEIIPQAICSRHGLLVGAWTIPLTMFFMVLTFPLSMPLSLILNLILGKEIGAVYNRDQLLKLLSVTKEHHDLENDEVDIISGVLAYKKKCARDVMTKFDDIFCIDIDSVLDFKMMRDIYDSGFSRIPVYEDTKENIVHLLYIRDLAFVDPDDNTTLASHVQFYQHELLFFFEDTPLDDILKGFLEGKCHLGVIQTIKEVPDKDPVYVAVGVITLEDILEEILQKEIVDETDRFTDNRSFMPRQSKKVDVGQFMDLTNSLTPQQRMAVYQFLSTEVDPFKEKYITSQVLSRLLMQKNIVQNISHDRNKGTAAAMNMYTSGNPADFFCLILEGCMEVEVGKDGLIFESHSFSHFGAQALTYAREEILMEYKPDFTARPVSDCVVVLITKRQYMAARKASVFGGGKAILNTPPGGSGDGGGAADGGISKDVFKDEWAKAETTDSQAKSSGLDSIKKFLYRYSQQSSSSADRRKSDQLNLLTEERSPEAMSPGESPLSPGISETEMMLGEGLGVEENPWEGSELKNFTASPQLRLGVLRQPMEDSRYPQPRTSKDEEDVNYQATQV